MRTEKAQMGLLEFYKLKGCESLKSGNIYVGRAKIPAIFESHRSEIYAEYLDILKKKDLLLDLGDATYFDARKYVNLYGNDIDVPYQGRPNRTVLISKSLPKLAFPLVVDGGKRFLWHFTSVIDDHLLKVTHVVRAMDKIDNQIPQTILNRALDFGSPIYLYTKILQSIMDDFSPKSVVPGQFTFDIKKIISIQRTL